MDGTNYIYSQFVLLFSNIRDIAYIFDKISFYITLRHLKVIFVHIFDINEKI